jgi:hypothetical protein
MILMKASGATYSMVVKQTVHAFTKRPAGIHPDEFVLLSKNREDCSMLEKQIQHIAKVLKVREASAEELERLFPGVGASDRWKWVVELYWVHRLPKPFNLAEITGFNFEHYQTVQAFAQVKESDALMLLDYLRLTNLPSLLDVLNNADPAVRNAR